MGKKTQFTGCTISANQCKCFDSLTDDENKLIEENSVLVEYKKGELICKRGSFASHIMFLEKGLVKVYIEDGTNTLVLKILPKRNLIGLTSVSEAVKTFEYSVMAYTNSEMRQIEIKVFKQLLQQNSLFAKDVIDVLSADSIQINSRFFVLRTNSRLADWLI